MSGQQLLLTEECYQLTEGFNSKNLFWRELVCTKAGIE